MNVDAAAPPSELDAIVYWGVGSSVPAGQPRTRRWRTRSSLRYSEGATGLADPARLAAIDVSASGRGEYRARVSYAGETRVTVGPTNDFLDPLTLSHPLDGKVDFGRPLAIAWAPVPRATAYCVVATARGGDGRTVLWESAWRCDLWERHGVDWSMRNNIVLPLDQTSVTIPAGIFMGGPVQVQITAISAASNRAGPFDARAWAQSRTSFVIGGRKP
ncbi:MAG: hypothetical protein EB084_24715 [Proteobacteria bacterium]|nr:hypothetical protein [Pseudomonadota bacterium]